MKAAEKQYCWSCVLSRRNLKVKIQGWKSRQSYWSSQMQTTGGGGGVQQVVTQDPVLQQRLPEGCSRSPNPSQPSTATSTQVGKLNRSQDAALMLFLFPEGRKNAIPREKLSECRLLPCEDNEPKQLFFTHLGKAGHTSFLADASHEF